MQDLDTRVHKPPPPPAGFAQRQRMRAAAARLFAAHGPEVPLSTIRIDAKVHPSATGAYVTREDVLADLLAEHLTALEAAVARAEADAAALPPEALLERLIRAWLDGVAAAPAAHRVWLFAAHVLPDQARGSLALRERIAIEHIQAALAAAVPALAERPDAPLTLFPLIRHLLSDPRAWPAPPDPETRQSTARRLAGMLLAAAVAEAAAHWPRLGRTEGAEPGAAPIALTFNQARDRLKHVLDAVQLGADITVTRRGKPVARVVPAR